MDKDAIKARIREISNLVNELDDILDSAEGDSPVAFLEVCQDVQWCTDQLLHSVMLPILMKDNQDAALED